MHQIDPLMTRVYYECVMCPQCQSSIKRLAQFTTRMTSIFPQSQSAPLFHHCCTWWKMAASAALPQQSSNCFISSLHSSALSLTSVHTHTCSYAQTSTDWSSTHQTLFFLFNEVLCLASSTNKYKHVGMWFSPIGKWNHILTEWSGAEREAWEMNFR